jgi:hypothetical protein
MEALISTAPYWVPVALFIALSLLNWLSDHYSSPETPELIRILRIALEYVSGLTSKNSPGTFKLPGTSVPPSPMDNEEADDA